MRHPEPAGSAQVGCAALQADLAHRFPARRLVADPLRLVAYGTDASFYRLVPKLVVVVENEEEVRELLALCRRHSAPLTFRAAGTSLSGQAVTDSVLALLGDGWRQCHVGPDALTVTLQPGVVGGEANRALAAHGRKIGPDPASINAAKIGGIAANNASGMCCGTAQNSYHTLVSMRVVLPDGTVLDTADPASRSAFAASHASLLSGLRELARRARADRVLAERIRRKYRLKNTTGYGLNALLDFEDPFDILIHLMIGSEGTLGFIASITLRTVPEHADKATALILFDDLETACRAVTALKATPVEAVELADRSALRSVDGKPGLPPAARSLGAAAAALLVETRAPDSATLRVRVAAIEKALELLPTVEPIRFSTDPGECATLWNLRKGMFPSVGAMREIGTTVIIEDVAFPVPMLAAATLELQALMRDHGYEGIIFGHALEGNLHFVFTQRFDDPAEVARYRRFMDGLAELVVGGYDGSLKAEHGTGRNMAPFVAREWGAHAYGLMREIKTLFDPHGLLNPGVILNDDRQVHIKNLKPLPTANAIVDRCIECGFCEPKCPSAGLTLTPRQRIVGLREIALRERQNPGAAALSELKTLYAYHGIDTCAACGLCATACPVSIETGVLTKALRGERVGHLARGVGDWVADHFALTIAGVRGGLRVADTARLMLGTDLLAGVAAKVRRLSANRVPKWSPAIPRAARFAPRPRSAANPGDGRRVVYFPSCAARAMGPARGDDASPLPEVAERLLRRAGYHVVYPEHLSRLCCGQPFESKGLAATADRMSSGLERSLTDASEGGRVPIVFDTSPCAYRMKRFLDARLDVRDVVEFTRDALLPHLPILKVTDTVAIHPVCSVRKMGLAEPLRDIAQACAVTVVEPPDVLCCGFAGDRGFTIPELNEHALRHLRAGLPENCASGYSTSRTCEIGLSEQAGFPYRSILHLVDRCTGTDD